MLTEDSVSTEEQVTVIHTDDQGSSDYSIALTCAYTQESGQWVGVCKEFGTSAFSDTLENARVELQEAIELQLNEIERLGYIVEYLDRNQVKAVPFPSSRQIGFTIVPGREYEHIRA